MCISVCMNIYGDFFSAVLRPISSHAAGSDIRHMTHMHAYAYDIINIKCLWSHFMAIWEKEKDIPIQQMHISPTQTNHMVSTSSA